MQTLTFTVTVQAPDKHTREEIRNLLNTLINVGLSDASDTVDDGIDNGEASIALDCNWESPK